MKRIISYFSVAFAAATLISCGDSTGDLVGLNTPAITNKVLSKITIEETGAPTYNVNYIYTAAKLTSVTTSDNSYSYAVEYNGNQVSKIVRTVNSVQPEVMTSNLVYTGSDLTKINGTVTQGGATTGTFTTTFTYAAGKPTKAKTEFFQPGTTVLISTVTSDFQYSGDNISKWIFTTEVAPGGPVSMPPIVMTVDLGNYDDKNNPYKTLPLAFTLANCNFEIDTEGPTGVSKNNYRTVSASDGQSTVSENVTYTYDSSDYPTKSVRPSATLKFEYNTL